MAITPITQVISETITPPTDLILASDVIPSDPNSVDAFVTAAESAFNVLTNDTVPDIQTVAEEINTVSSQMNVLAGQVDTLATTVQESANIAIAIANYKGDWVAGYNTTGYSLNMSVSYTDGYNYVSKINNNLIEPTSKTNTSQWNFIEAVNPNDYYDKTEINSLLGDKLDTLIPTGVIIMWSGSIASIPAGWALCDGANGTPDLRNRFIVGASADNVGVSNTTITGSNTKTGGSKDSTVVAHTHTADHSHTGSTNSTGAHTHAESVSISSGSNFNLVYGSGYGASPQQTSSAGAHSHTVTVNSASVTTSSAGSSGTNANLPPYLALAYIMKL